VKGIQKANGGFCSPHAFVKAAEPEDSPLHDDIFGKDDAEAAYEHRLSIARRMIRGVRVISSPAEQKHLHVRVSNGTTQEGYVDIDTVAQHADYRTFVLREAQSALLSYRRRWGWLSELSAVWSAIDESVEEQE
jgi:hypothetical protein